MSLKREIMVLLISLMLIALLGVTSYAENKPKDPQVIVSLTSFPARIKTVHKTIKSILRQTEKPNKIILWLSYEEFPKMEKELPKSLLSLKNERFSIEWCHNIKPHNKYFYTMKKYPDDIVITVDDDLIYRKNLVKTLMSSYRRYPKAVSALRAHLIKFNDKGLLSYKKWRNGSGKILNKPSMRLFATGVGGVLYPPHCMHKELFNKEMIKKTCINADDIWLKFMQVMNGTPVVLVGGAVEAKSISGTQKYSLRRSNVGKNRNDKQIYNVLREYNEYFGKDDTLINRIKENEIGA